MNYGHQLTPEQQWEIDRPYVLFTGIVALVEGMGLVCAGVYGFAYNDWEATLAGCFSPAALILGAVFTLLGWNWKR